MKLAVLGSGGVGRVIAKTVAKTGRFKEIICADISEETVNNLLLTINKENFHGTVVDASDYEQVKKLALKVDVLVNAVIPRFNLIVMKACLAGQCHYLDLACDTILELPGKIDLSEQLDLDQHFSDAGLLALCGIGIDPGCTNIFARYLANQMDEIEDILIRDADVSSVQGHDIALYFSPDTFIDECITEAPLFYENGMFVIKEPLEKIEDFTFPDPIGKVPVYAISHEEAWTIPRFIKKNRLKKCNFGYALPGEMVNILKVLKTLGLDSEKPLNIKGNKVAPRDVVIELLPKPAELAGKIKGNICVGTLVRGFKNGRKKELFMYNRISHETAYHSMQEQGTSYQTGIPAALAADLLAEGVIKTRGAVTPEALDPEPFIKNLPRYGLEIEIEERL